MKKTVIGLILAAAILLPLSAEDILLKDDTKIAEADVMSKDQFGIIVKVKEDPKTKHMLRKFVSFYEMNPISLNKFAFCDAKTIERIYMAVQDRATLAQNKFAARIAEYKDKKDYNAMLQIHTGVSVYKVMFAAYQSADTGLIGYMYSDTAEMQFYGIVFLYGLLGDGDEVFIGNVYPTTETKEINGITYPVLTIINPEGDNMTGVVFSDNTPTQSKRLPPKYKFNDNGMKPAQGADGKGMMPPPLQGADGKGMMPPPGGGNGKMMPPPPDADGKQRPQGDSKGNRKNDGGKKRNQGERQGGNPGGGFDPGPGGGGGGAMPPPPPAR